MFGFLRLIVQYKVEAMRCFGIEAIMLLMFPEQHVVNYFGDTISATEFSELMGSQIDMVLQRLKIKQLGRTCQMRKTEYSVA